MLRTNIFPIDPLYYQAESEKQLYSTYQEQIVFRPESLVDVPLATEDDFAAIQELNHLVDCYSLDPVFWLALGETFYVHRLYPAAVAAIEVAKEIMLQPGFEEALECHEQRLLAMLVCAYRAVGEQDTARAYCQDLGHDDPFCVVLSAYCCLETDMEQMSEDILLSGLDHFPNSAEIACELGRYYFSQRDLAKAKTYFLAAYEENPRHILTLSGLAILHLLDGLDWESFKAYADKAIQCLPQSPVEQYQIGQLHFLLQNYEAAKQLYAQAPIGPYYAEIWSHDEIYREFGV